MIREDIFSLPEGRVVIQWPAYLSTESVEAVKEWLALFQRKLAKFQEAAIPSVPLGS